MFAGLWESWREMKESEPLYTYTIVTGPPGLVSGDIHDRAPVILDEGAWDAWLTGDCRRARHPQGSAGAAPDLLSGSEGGRVAEE
jgi:putative SOS response-associated peptidase YedK